MKILTKQLTKDQDRNVWTALWCILEKCTV